MTVASRASERGFWGSVERGRGGDRAARHSLSCVPPIERPPRSARRARPLSCTPNRPPPSVSEWERAEAERSPRFAARRPPPPMPAPPAPRPRAATRPRRPSFGRERAFTDSRWRKSGAEGRAAAGARRARGAARGTKADAAHPDAPPRQPLHTVTMARSLFIIAAVLLVAGASAQGMRRRGRGGGWARMRGSPSRTPFAARALRPPATAASHWTRAPDGGRCRAPSRPVIDLISPPPPAPPAPLGLQAAAAAGDDCITIAARMRTGPCAKLQDSTMVRGGRGEGGRKGVDGDEGQGHAQPLDDPRPATPTPPGQDARDHRDGLPRARRVQGDDAGRARVVLPRPPLFHHPGAARGTPHAGAGGGRRGEARPDPKSSSHRAARARRM